MVSDVMTFNSDIFGTVRTVKIEDIIWFVAKDVASALGYSNPNEAIQDHVEDDDKLNSKTLSSLGQRGGWLINESGLYSLILSSKLPKAREFKHWITSEILPSIRSNGGYIANQENMTDAELIAKALIVANNVIANKDKMIAEQKQKLIEQQPKVDFYNDVTGSADTIDMGELAKVLNVKGLGRNKLFEFLRKHKILDNRNQPYQKYVDMGLFRIVESQFSKPNGDICVNLKTVVFQKGVDYIRRIAK